MPITALIKKDSKIKHTIALSMISCSLLSCQAEEYHSVSSDVYEICSAIGQTPAALEGISISKSEKKTHTNGLLIKKLDSMLSRYEVDEIKEQLSYESDCKEEFKSVLASNKSFCRWFRRDPDVIDYCITTITASPSRGYSLSYRPLRGGAYHDAMINKIFDIR